MKEVKKEFSLNKYQNYLKNFISVLEDIFTIIQILDGNFGRELI